MDSRPDPYRGVVFILIAGVLVATGACMFGGFALGNPVLLQTAVSLGLSAGVLIGVALVQANRSGPARAPLTDAMSAEVRGSEPGPVPETGLLASDEPSQGSHHAPRTRTIAFGLPSLIAATRKWRLQGSTANLYLLISVGWEAWASSWPRCSDGHPRPRRPSSRPPLVW